MVSYEQARQSALALPEAIERDHHERPLFRVAGKIFATLWDEHMNVLLDEGGILAAVQGAPETCAANGSGFRILLPTPDTGHQIATTRIPTSREGGGSVAAMDPGAQAP